MPIRSPVAVLSWFVACHAARPESDYRIHFEGEDFLKYVPNSVPGLQVVKPADLGKKTNIRLARNNHEFELDFRAGYVFGYVDGVRSVGDILKAVDYFGPERAQAVEMARGLFGYLAITGHLAFRLPA